MLMTMASIQTLPITLAFVILAFTLECHAGSPTCTGILYLKQNFADEHVNITLTPQGDVAKVVYSHADPEHKDTTPDSWSAVVNSALLLCSCSSGDCSQDFPKVLLRLYATPHWKHTGGGDHIDVNCTTYGVVNSCSGALAWMPAGWGPRAAGAALLYNERDYMLPSMKQQDKKKPSRSTAAQPGSGPSQLHGPRKGPGRRRRQLRAQLRGIAP